MRLEHPVDPLSLAVAGLGHDYPTVESGLSPSVVRLFQMHVRTVDQTQKMKVLAGGQPCPILLPDYVLQQSPVHAGSVERL